MRLPHRLRQDQSQYNNSVNREALRQEALEVDRLEQDKEQYDQSVRSKKNTRRRRSTKKT